MTIFADFPPASLANGSAHRAYSAPIRRNPSHFGRLACPQYAAGRESARGWRARYPAPSSHDASVAPDRWPLPLRLAIHATGAGAGWLLLGWSLGLV